MNGTIEQAGPTADRLNNMRATFEILAYLQVDARKDGHPELADRLEFAMIYAEQKLKELKISPQTSI